MRRLLLALRDYVSRAEDICNYIIKADKPYLILTFIIIAYYKGLTIYIIVIIPKCYDPSGPITYTLHFSPITISPAKDD
jgi:hypothetical protein